LQINPLTSFVFLIGTEQTFSCLSRHCERFG
jgi:hypothetical protein